MWGVAATSRERCRWLIARCMVDTSEENRNHVHSYVVGGEDWAEAPELEECEVRVW